MSGVHFADRLLEAIDRKGSHVVAGLDPDYELIPSEVREEHPLERYSTVEEMKSACYLDFLRKIVDGVSEHVVAVKVQIAYFEALGYSEERISVLTSFLPENCDAGD